MAGAPALGLAALLALTVPAPLTDVDMRAETDRLAAALAGVRRITLRGPLERRLVTADEARAEKRAAMATVWASTQMQDRARLWQRLGLLPAQGDPVAVAASGFGASPAAFYDPGRQRLAVPAWLPLEQQRTSLAHELAHALCDQRFGLRRTLQLGADGHHGLDTDGENARWALIEGDANIAALELADRRATFLGAHELPLIAQRLRDAAAPALAGLPAWVREPVTFAHADGLTFVARVRARAGWPGVDALWAAPPASSEQLLHPDKYDRHDAPVPLEAAPLRALATWRQSGTDVLGELGVRTWLAAAAPELIAERAASGWGGDRAVLYLPAATAGDAGPAAEPLATWLTVWDDVTDAEDFARTALPVLATLAARPAAAEPPGDDPRRAVQRGPNGVFALAWRANAVAMLLGASEAALPALYELLDQAPHAAGPSARPGGSRRGAPVR